MRNLLSKVLVLAIAGIIGFSVVASAESRYDMVMKKGELIAGCKDQTVPFGFRDKRNRIVGFDADLLQYIAKKMGVKLRLVPVTSATRIPLVADGTLDIVAASMTHTKSRDKQIDYSITYFFDGQKIMVKKGSGIKGPQDAAGKKISVVKGTTTEKNLLAVQPRAKLVHFDQQPEAFRALDAGIIDGISIDSTQLLGLKGDAPNPDDFEIVGEFFSEEPLALGLPEDDSKWRDFINEVLIEMWNNGEWLKIYNKWFGPGTKYEFTLDFEMATWPLR